MAEQSLKGRTLYIPQMNYAGSRALAAVFRSVGIDATVSPDSDAQTLELGGRYTSGDECYPEKVTLGNFLKLTEMESFKPEKTALFMATANGPCRFGQYSVYIQKVMQDLGYSDVMRSMISFSSIGDTQWLADSSMGCSAPLASISSMISLPPMISPLMKSCGKVGKLDTSGSFSMMKGASRTLT